METQFLSTLSLRRATHGCYSLRHSAQFLSTLSLRRATAPNRRPYHCNRNFYPRSPCGERRHWPGFPVVGRSISIHALLAESDPPVREIVQWEGIFLSTLSLRRATQKARPKLPANRFLSTLSLRRATKSLLTSVVSSTDFYPRSPCGERQNPSKLAKTSRTISIHALLAESDSSKLKPPVQTHNFYPRSPCGERQYLVRGQRPNWGISIHALLAESDGLTQTDLANRAISIHALLAESDRFSVLDGL